MKAHWLYLKYVVRHKFFVFVAGWRLGVPFHRLIIHDWTKFLPREWFPYVDFFYGQSNEVRSNYFHNPENTSEVAIRFNAAWNHHQKKNDHHWQWWVITLDMGKTFILPMSGNARLEMLADWIGAGKVQGSKPVQEWYTANKEKIQLHPDTREWLEKMLISVHA